MGGDDGGSLPGLGGDGGAIPFDDRGPVASASAEVSAAVAAFWAAADAVDRSAEAAMAEALDDGDGEPSDGGADDDVSDEPDTEERRAWPDGSQCIAVAASDGTEAFTEGFTEGFDDQFDESFAKSSDERFDKRFDNGVSDGSGDRAVPSHVEPARE